MPKLRLVFDCVNSSRGYQNSTPRLINHKPVSGVCVLYMMCITTQSDTTRGPLTAPALGGGKSYKTTDPSNPRAAHLSPKLPPTPEQAVSMSAMTCENAITRSNSGIQLA